MQMFDVDRIILIDKPAGLSSFGVVARVRRLLTERAGRKVKVGHCGTLDPFATGLLILVSGKNTKRAMEFTKLDKVYRATIRLGATSTTGDPEGEIAPTDNPKIPTLDKIKQVIDKYVGTIKQRPPQFSAIKINGRRAYHLARAGQEFEVPERTVEIYSIDIIDYSYPNLTIETHVSSGTYIRTLGEDIGRDLGVGGYLTDLRRLKIADFDINQAQTIEQFAAKLEV